MLQLQEGISVGVTTPITNKVLRRATLNATLNVRVMALRSVEEIGLYPCIKLIITMTMVGALSLESFVNANLGLILLSVKKLDNH